MENLTRSLAAIRIGFISQILKKLRFPAVEILSSGETLILDGDELVGNVRLSETLKDGVITLKYVLEKP